MDIDELTDFVLDKWEDVHGYIETNEKHMRKVVFKYLTTIHRYDIECATMRLQHNKMSGMENSKEDYVKEFKQAEDNLMIQAELIAVGSKEDLEYFI